MNSVLASTSSLPSKAEASNSAALLCWSFVSAAVFYSAHLPLDVRGHAAVEAPFVQIDQRDNGNGANYDSNNFKHWGNS